MIILNINMIINIDSGGKNCISSCNLDTNYQLVT